MPVLPERVWTASVNNALDISSLSNHQKDSFLKLHNLLKTAGWTVTLSSNGTVSGAADHIATIADVNWNTGTWSWAVYQSPANFVGGGNFVYLLLSLDSGSQQTLRSNMSGAPYTGGTTASNPTNVNTQGGPSQQTWLTNVLPAASNWNGSYSDHGDVHYGISKVGSQIMQSSYSICSCADAQPTDLFPVFALVRNQEGDPRGAYKRDSFTLNNGMGALWINGAAVSGTHALCTPCACDGGFLWLQSATGVDDGIDNSELDLVQLGLYGLAGGAQPAAPRARAVDLFAVKDGVLPGAQADATWTNWGSYMIYSPVPPVF